MQSCYQCYVEKFSTHSTLSHWYQTFDTFAIGHFSPVLRIWTNRLCRKPSQHHIPVYGIWKWTRKQNHYQFYRNFNVSVIFGFVFVRLTPARLVNLSTQAIDYWTADHFRMRSFNSLFISNTFLLILLSSATLKQQRWNPGYLKC